MNWLRAALAAMFIVVTFSPFAILPPFIALADDLPQGVPPDTEKAVMVGPVDGDKIEIDYYGENQEVLLSGIDAPEKGECFFEESLEYLAKLLPQGTIIHLETSNENDDGDARLLRYVWLPGKDGAKATLINTKLVREGYAGFDGSKDSPKYFDRIEELQKDAQEKKKGLWKSCGGVHESAPTKGEQSQVSRCLDVPAQLQESIASGLIPEAGATLRGFQAVRSNDFESVWMIAADLEGPELDGIGQIGVWATNDLNANGLILAVDGIAKEFSVWPRADETDAQITLGDDGVSEAVDCTSEALK